MLPKVVVRNLLIINENARMAPHMRRDRNRVVRRLMDATHEQERAPLFRGDRTLFASILSRLGCPGGDMAWRSPPLCRGEGPARDTPTTGALKLTPSS